MSSRGVNLYTIYTQYSSLPIFIGGVNLKNNYLQKFMTTQNPESNQEALEKSKKEGEARMAAEGLRMDYATRDKWAVEQEEKAPSPQDYIKDLTDKSAQLQEALVGLKKAVMEGDNKSSDLEKKVDFEKLLDKIKMMTLHALVRPEEPRRVRMAQSALETATADFQRDHIATTEAISKILAGEARPGELESGRPDIDKKWLEKVIADLPKEELAKLQNEVQAALERLQAALPRVEQIAAEKSLPADQKEEKLKQYEDMYKIFEEYSKDAQYILDNLRKQH